MVTGGKLRHHSAIGRMQIDLTVQTLGEQPPLGVEKGYACFVAGGFDAEYAHGV